MFPLILPIVGIALAAGVVAAVETKSSSASSAKSPANPASAPPRATSRGSDPGQNVPASQAVSMFLVPTGSPESSPAATSISDWVF